MPYWNRTNGIDDLHRHRLAMQDFGKTDSVDGSPLIFTATPDATRGVHSDMRIKRSRRLLTELEERVIVVGALGSTRIAVVRIGFFNATE